MYATPKKNRGPVLAIRTKAQTGSERGDKETGSSGLERPVDSYYGSDGDDEEDEEDEEDGGDEEVEGKLESEEEEDQEEDGGEAGGYDSFEDQLDLNESEAGSETDEMAGSKDHDDLTFFPEGGPNSYDDDDDSRLDLEAASE